MVQVYQHVFWCLKSVRKNPDDILFIDSSQHFEKVKTQNYLRESDVDRIVETYAKRVTIDKY
jgi:type I restriction enzyme M protein